jgi:Zn finger protein HypA/HybF involved in hydrogenase expression
MEVLDFNRTLEQELLALSRGVSLECLVCGEFLLRRGSALHCPECGSSLGEEAEVVAIQLEFDLQAG